MLLAVTCFLGVIGDTSNNSVYQDNEYGFLTASNIETHSGLEYIIDEKSINDLMIYDSAISIKEI